MSKLKGFIDKAKDFIGDEGNHLASAGIMLATGNVSGAISEVTQAVRGHKELEEEFEANKAEYELEVLKLQYADKASARQMYENTDHELADYVAKRVINYNLWVVIAAIIIEVAAVIYINDKVLIAIISGAIGSVTTALIQERQTVIGFLFGSSKGSKDKDRAAKR